MFTSSSSCLRKYFSPLVLISKFKYLLWLSRDLLSRSTSNLNHNKFLFDVSIFQVSTALFHSVNANMCFDVFPTNDPFHLSLFFMA